MYTDFVDTLCFPIDVYSVQETVDQDDVERRHDDLKEIRSNKKSE